LEALRAYLVDTLGHDWIVSSAARVAADEVELACADGLDLTDLSHRLTQRFRGARVSLRPSGDGERQRLCVAVPRGGLPINRRPRCWRTQLIVVLLLLVLSFTGLPALLLSAHVSAATTARATPRSDLADAGGVGATAPDPRIGGESRSGVAPTLPPGGTGALAAEQPQPLAAANAFEVAHAAAHAADAAARVRGWALGAA
jgi:hypothetical protein